MPHVQVSIGGRFFDVACQAGEESYLHSAAALLDEEAQVLVQQIGRMPESRMLLMAGLMLADKVAGAGDAAALQARVAELEAENAALKARAPETVTVEVPVIPEGLTEALVALAGRAEALADEVEEKATA
ncbi:cell division protein ZapA [Donghicola sp. C2-DW-16]|uniref:Cell division protein ZapA n=1 Tax=Donghicola mangrovi TaxID=2729614 RepID=A0ABX2PBT3_9RHOB|nr:cell division protein ZapA [Donghicola mangrovi]NVO26935.1 cell division protein ZapA [Donghicola mangrovi]